MCYCHYAIHADVFYNFSNLDVGGWQTPDGSSIKAIIQYTTGWNKKAPTHSYLDILIFTRGSGTPVLLLQKTSLQNHHRNLQGWTLVFPLMRADTRRLKSHMFHYLVMWFLWIPADPWTNGSWLIQRQCIARFHLLQSLIMVRLGVVGQALPNHWLLFLVCSNAAQRLLVSQRLLWVWCDT